ncbi:MAG: metallophosphoesterase family protein [Deltaproteobacteria bacterium]|nr:MAG: metallophosphoesterase family protein [Deltaproteobacteria bacterium]
MVVIYTSDLHGNRELYLGLLDLAERKSAQAIIVGGDMLPIHGPFQSSLQEQRDFISGFLGPTLRNFLSNTSQVEFYAMLGNDDWQASTVHLEGLAEAGLLKLLHAQRHDLGDGYELIGYGHVPPTPFTIKDGERRDLTDDATVGQRCTACVSQGEKIVAIDPFRYFVNLESIEEELSQLPGRRESWMRVYVMHSPPFSTHLDRMSDGRWIGSRAIRAFIEEQQPYVTLHGHIHESPEISGEYLDRIGKTVCINPGQSTEELYAVSFELEDVLGSVEHTVFGRPEPGA